MAGAGIHPYHQQWPPAPAPPPPPATVAASLPPPPPVHHPPPASSHDEVRTVFITGLPEDFKERELQNLLRWLPGYEASQVNYKGEKPLGFALFSSAQLAVAARDALQEMVFDAESKSVLHTEMAKKNLFVKRGIVADSNSYDQSKRLRTGGDYSHSAYTTPSPFYPPPPPVWGPHGYLAPTPPYDPYGGYHVPPVPMPAPTPVPAPSSYVPVQENNGDDTTCCLIYKANILNSIRDRTANSSVPDGILDSLLLIEKFDRRLGIYPSDSMRDAFRAVAVHCTLRCLPVSWSSYFDAVQRIWELRIRNLEDSGVTDLLSPDLAQWRTKIEGALWDNEASQRLLNICSLGEALNCIGAYLREAFRSMKPASCRLAMVPTARPTVDHATSASVSRPTEENGDLRENSHSSPGGLEEDRSSSRNHGNLSTSEVNELLPMAHEINATGLQAGPIDSHHEAVEVAETVAIDTAREGLHKEESNKDKSDPTTSICPATYYCNDKGKRRHPLPPTVDNVVASAQVSSSPHRCTNDGNVDNSVSASAQLQLIPYCCTDKENGNMRENSHSSPGQHEGPVSTAELQAGPTDSLNEALEVTETVASDKARESLHMEDPNEDMGDPTTSHCPTTHNCNDSGKRTTRANSRRYKVLSSRRRHKRPVIISDLEEVERVASDMGSEDLHAKAIEEDSNKDKGDPTNCCSDKGKPGSPMVISQTRRDSNSSPKHSEGPAAYADAKVDLPSYKKYGSISSPEIEKVRDSLKSSVADLLAAVTDPLPRVLEVADRIASYVAAAKELHTECAERDGKEEKGVTATSTDCNIEHAQAKMRVSNEAVRKDHNRMDGSVQAKRKAPDEVIGKDHERTDMNFPAPSVNHTAEPSQAEEGNDAYIRPKSVCRTRLMERNDTAHTVEWEDTIEGSEEGTSGSSNKCSLPSPKTNHVSPLKRSESLKWARRRKINRWTDEEEKALIEGVRKYGSQWKLILSVYAEILSNRTQVDLKDKWRNLSRKC